MITATQIVDYARTLIGTPFHHQGRLPGVGLDCIGTIQAPAAALGLPHRDSTDYSRRPRLATLLERIAWSMDEIEAAEASVGDVLVFDLGGKGRLPHAALLTDSGMLHCYAGIGGSGRVVEHGLDDRWRAWIQSAWRYRRAD